MDIAFAPNIKRSDYEGSLVMKLPDRIDEGSMYIKIPRWITRLQDGFWILPIKSLYVRKLNKWECSQDPKYIFEKDEGEWECRFYHPFEEYLPRPIKHLFSLRLELVKKHSVSLSGWELILKELLEAKGIARERVLCEWKWTGGVFELLADNVPSITQLKTKKSIIERLATEVMRLGPYSFFVLDALTYMFPEHIRIDYLDEEDIKEMNKSCYYS